MMKLSLVLVIAACGKDKGTADCDDVEAAMRRLEPERTASIKQGTFARVCRAEFDQARIDCTVKATATEDLKACAGKAPPPKADKPPEPPAKPAALAPLAPLEVPLFGIVLQVPSDAKIASSSDHDVHITNGSFKLNLFAVDTYSYATAAAAKAGLAKEPGFVKFTTETTGDKTWRFDYELAGGRAGTQARLDVGRPLDCGVHGQHPDLVAATAAACQSAKKR